MREGGSPRAAMLQWGGIAVWAVVSIEGLVNDHIFIMSVAVGQSTYEACPCSARLKGYLRHCSR